MRILKQKNKSSFFKFCTSNGEELIVNPVEPIGLYQLEFDLYNIATAFFELERKLISEQKDVTNVIISITKNTYHSINCDGVIEILNDLSIFIFNKNIKFQLFPYGSYQSKISETNEIYNEGYNTLRLFNVKRPILKYMGTGIGGHCIWENAVMMEEHDIKTDATSSIIKGKKNKKLSR